jgi:hypothetical protein
MCETNKVNLKEALVLKGIKVLGVIVSMRDFPSVRRF